MKRWLWLVLLAPAAQACELPGGAAQKIESPKHTVLYRTAPLRVVGATERLAHAVRVE